MLQILFALNKTHWLNEKGIEAHMVKTAYEGELSEMAENANAEETSRESDNVTQ